MEAPQQRSDSGSAPNDQTPDPAQPASGVGVSGRRLLSALVPIGILVALVASDLLLCPVKLLVGVPCPGCGVTRAAFAALHGDLGEALRHHPLVWLIVPLVTWTLLRVSLVSAGILSAKSFDPIDRLPNWFWWVSVVLLLGVYAVRMAGGLGGPSDPIDPANGLIGKLVSQLWS